MAIDQEEERRSLGLETRGLEEGSTMVREDRWTEIRRLCEAGRSISEIARRFDLDRKTVRKWLRRQKWSPYRRPERVDTLLAEHADYLRRRAPEVEYSARILYQELRTERGYRGSYDTVKLFVRPLRAVRRQAERALVRFETPPGHQSQIDWGVARVHFRHRSVVQHIFVLTLGYSRRSYYRACSDERIDSFLDSHEQAFEHFGGRTREHLYDRPRTVCHGTAEKKVVWNPTFRAFADYWGFEPRLCRPYRAQTKGKVESGVKYFRRNFLPGRSFVDERDFAEQLGVWISTVADVRVHGTTHERPLDRFVEESRHLTPSLGQPSFRLEARLMRIVAEDYLVSVDTNRYSVPFSLIGQPVEVRRHDGQLHVYHRGELVAEHTELVGKHGLKILPEHGPGAILRNTRKRHSSPRPKATPWTTAEVEIRDLSVYDEVATQVSGATR
jgi:transposase